MPGPAAAAIATGLGSAAIGAYGASKAAGAMSDASGAQLAMQREMFDRMDALQGELYDEQTGTINQGFRQNLGDINANQGQQIDLANALGMYGMLGAQQTHDENESLFRREMRNGTDRIQDATRGAISGFRPALRLGNNALSAYAENLGVGNAKGYKLGMTPGGEFLMDKMQEGVQGSAAAGGGLFSGATLEALQKEAAGIAALDRDTQQSQLFGLAGMGQDAAGSIANLKTGGAQSVNALRQGYGDRIAGGNDALFRNLYGIGGDWTRGVGGALDSGLDRRIGARDFRTGALGAARANRANLHGQAAGQYMQGAGQAYQQQGQAGALGGIGMTNALANGINAGFGTFGYMGGQMPWMQAPPANPQAIPTGIGTGGQGPLY